MTIRFFKRVPLLPGIRANFSKRGISLSIGHRGAWYTIGTQGDRATFGGLGTGLYWTQYVKRERVPPQAPPDPIHRAMFAALLIAALIAIGMIT